MVVAILWEKLIKTAVSDPDGLVITSFSTARRSRFQLWDVSPGCDVAWSTVNVALVWPHFCRASGGDR